MYRRPRSFYKEHLLYQFKRARELICGDFIFVCFQDKSLTKFTRKALEEQLQLKECDSDYSNKTIIIIITIFIQGAHFTKSDIQ